MRKGPLEDDLQYIAKYPLQYEQLKETTVLVTGATGLIGASIVRALIAVEGIHIIALVRNIEKANKLYSRHELDNIELIVGDITFPINVILGIQILVPTGREKIVLYSEIVGAVVDVIINALLIPVYASTGAAIGTLVAEFAVFVVQFYALKDEILNTFRQIHYIKILIALSVGSIVSLWVKILNLECFFSLVISSLLFFGAYGFVLLILKEELFLEIFNTIKNKII